MRCMGKMNLSETEWEQLLAAVRSRTIRAADSRRAKLILMPEDGASRDTIMQRLQCDSRFISRWSGRFVSERLAGMYARHPGRAPKQPPAKLEARVLSHTLKRKSADGSTRWSSYKLAAELGDISASAVQRIWRKHSVRPHRLERHMVSNDPDFETKAADVIALYLNPPGARGRVLRGREDGDSDAGPQGPHAAAVVGACREPRLRIQAQRHAEPVRRAQHCRRSGAGQDRAAPHQRAVRGLPETTSAATRPNAWTRSSPRIATCTSTSRRPTRRG
jgi:hypothetical protein